MVAEIQNLTVRYGSLAALTHVSTALPEGATGLLGPNGAGKSTLIKTMLGFLSPAEGSVRVLGWNAASDPLEIRARSGYMPESEAFLPGLNAIETTALAGELGGLSRTQALSRGHEVLAYVGLGEARYRQVATYSAGMKARVKLAQALVADPDLLLLDEPTNGLDPQGRADMLGLIRDISRRLRIHVLLSSHLLHDVEEICEHAILVDRGTVVVQGKISELRALRERSWEVRVRVESEAFRQALRTEGGTVRGEAADLEVVLPEEQGTDPILRAAIASGVELVRLRRRERSLPEVFVEAVRAGTAAGAR